MWLTLLFGGTAALFLAMTIAALFHLRWAQRLPSLKELAVEHIFDESNAPRCSVVVAARNEEARLESAIRHLLAQDGVSIEVIVVDDRSTDRTGDILGRLAAEDARVQVKRVDVLPAGWLGKCHACHVGASAATGDWILFTDADCWLKPDVIARALLVANRDGADHITLTSGIALANLSVQALHLAFLVRLASWFAGVNRDRPNGYLGIGAFNLVRTPAYRQCGGYEALRLTVLDDVRLGLLLRRAGKRTRGFMGGDDAECHWGTTLRGMVKVVEKNYFAAMDFRLSLALTGSSVGTLLLCAAVIGPFTKTAAGIAAGLAFLSLIIPAVIVARRLAWPFTSALLTPFVYPVLFYAMLNSALVTLRQGGVRWRDTFYPLDILRKGTVR